MHVPVAKSFLHAGIHVICDKPLATTLDEANELARLARASGRLFGVTYTYSGYPLVRHARALVAAGEIDAGRRIRLPWDRGRPRPLFKLGICLKSGRDARAPRVRALPCSLSERYWASRPRSI